MATCDHPAHPAPLDVPDKLLFTHIRASHHEEWCNIERGRLLPDVDAIVDALVQAAADLDGFAYARAHAIATMRIAAASLVAQQPPAHSRPGGSL